MARNDPKPPQDVLINPIHGPVDPKDREPIPGGGTGQEGARGGTTGTTTGTPTTVYPNPPPDSGITQQQWDALPEKERKKAWEATLGVAGVAVESGGFGGGGGGGAAPVDPMVSAGAQIYFRLWGQNAPEGYIEKLVKGGLNVYEIEEHERRKPAFRRTKTYRDEAASYTNRLATILGTR